MQSSSDFSAELKELKRLQAFAKKVEAELARLRTKTAKLEAENIDVKMQLSQLRQQISVVASRR